VLYTVVWSDTAILQLAAIWNAAGDRNAVSAAQHQIDRTLRINPPLNVDPDIGRCTIDVLPLRATYEIVDLDRLVRVHTLERIP
jgi:plasmid stabilization system protein ParE